MFFLCVMPLPGAVIRSPTGQSRSKLAGVCWSRWRVRPEIRFAPRRLPLRRGALRGDRATDRGLVLPLHAMPAAHRCRRVGPGARRAGFGAVLSGADLVRVWQPPDGFGKAFCSACGSALWSIAPGADAPASVRLGAFDADPGVRPSYRQFTAYAAALGADPGRRPAALSGASAAEP